MSRSFWKGNKISNNFVVPLYINSARLNRKVKLKRTTNNYDMPEVRLYNRNHVVTLKHLFEIEKISSLYIYNGYDFFLQNTTMKPSSGASYSDKQFNLAEKVSTRETNVMHKAKVSKNAKKIVKRSFKKTSNTKKLVYKSTLSKKYTKNK